MLKVHGLSDVTVDPESSADIFDEALCPKARAITGGLLLCLVDALMRASAKENLSELLSVSQRLSLALVVRHFL